MTISEYDAAFSAGEAKLREAFGEAPIPSNVWDIFLAAVQALINGCADPTPTNLKAQVARPLQQLLIVGTLRAHGMPLRYLFKSRQALIAAVSGAPEVDIEHFVAAVKSVQLPTLE